ncbi:MAG: IPT/TIG domain-containing protein, partial [Acidobacteriota bacterium]|nr:IPT/TIG domain-containing protein [Acidobacteriota bacterium]
MGSRTVGTAILTGLLTACGAWANAPRIFYSDLVGGPVTGGDNGLGVIVTIAGVNFGSARGGSFVRIGGQQAASYREWTDSEIVFQPGAAAAAGGIEVHTRAGFSNTVPFEVRAGKIHFVASNGNDNASGSFSAPWKTIPHAVQTARGGDVIYALDGVAQQADDGQGWDAALTLRAEWCSAGMAKALVAYPGAMVTIGSDAANSPSNGLRSTDFSGDGGACAGNWTFAGLRFRGLNPVAINGPSASWRFVGNDISCPLATGADGGGACFETTLASNVAFYGNNVHDAGAAQASALFQGVYFSTDSNHIDMGWNTVANVRGCRGVQVHSSPLGSNYPKSGYDQYDIAIHDNLIHDTQCDGIILDTIDPSKGPVWVYNNIIYAAGKGPANPENTGNWSCIYVPATTENGPAGSGAVEVFN